jgi:hypothetical protein
MFWREVCGFDVERTEVELADDLIELCCQVVAGNQEQVREIISCCMCRRGEIARETL